MEEIKVLFTRGGGSYIVQYGEKFYLLDIERPELKALMNNYVEAFLKWGYCDDVDQSTITPKMLQTMKEIIYNDPRDMNAREKQHK